jgi:uncharacterized protein (TIGR03083 family)
MDRDDLWAALDTERAGLADLLETFGPEQWAHPSLCAGWTVREVVAHLALGPRLTVPGAIAELVRARGSFNRMIDRTARRHATRPELVADLRGTLGTRRLAPGQKLRDAVMDILVHGQDIAVPLGLTHPMPPAAARDSAQHLWQTGFPFHTRRRLAGYRLIATDLDWTAGTGPEIRGPAEAILPLLAGRTATLPRLSGPGVPLLTART